MINPHSDAAAAAIGVADAAVCVILAQQVAPVLLCLSQCLSLS